MKILSKKIVLRKASLRLIALLCCLIGVFAVWNWKEKPNEAVFKIHVKPEFSKIEAMILKKIIQERDLSNYELGETFSDCNGVEMNEFKQCEKSLNKGREFIYEHLKNKKRGYIVYEWAGVDNSGEIYIFIEPDESGSWQVIRKQESLYSYNIESWSAVTIKRRSKTEDGYKPRVGKYYLVFLDNKGEIILEL
jgi:hypothetical protein